MKYKTFFFDFDYTLGDATEGIVECVNYALNQMGLQPKGRDEIRKTVGMTLGDMFSSFTGISDNQTREQFFTHFMSRADMVMTEKTVLIADSIAVLSRLKQSGFKTAVVTTKVRYRIEEILKKYDIEDLLDLIIGLEDVTAPKPSPEGLLKAIDYFGDGKQDVLFIGDSLIDANTANNAGVDFAAVLTGTTAREEFHALPSVFVADTLTEILEFCES